MAIDPLRLQLGREANDNDLAHANEVLGSLIERALLLADEANLPFVAINLRQALERLDADKGRYLPPSQKSSNVSCGPIDR